LDHLPRVRGENQEYLSCHHLQVGPLAVINGLITLVVGVMPGAHLVVFARKKITHTISASLTGGNLGL